MDKQPVEVYRQHVKPYITSKLEEFKLLGYDDISEEELWAFLINKKWKKVQELMLYELVADIAGTKVSDVLNYSRIQAYQNTGWLESEEGKKLIEDLL
ncbi:post-transcriptional regulator [Metabacillus lacus]|nr:post-transcriptional regulator [Metabacillus lacus]